MSAYHKKVKQSIEKFDPRLFTTALTLPDLQEAVKGRFTSLCTALGIQTLITMMDQDVEAVAGPKANTIQTE